MPEYKKNNDVNKVTENVTKNEKPQTEKKVEKTVKIAPPIKACVF